MMAILRKLAKLSRLAGTASYRKALSRGVAAAIEHEGLIKRLAVGTLIDVGANKGQFSLLVREHHPEAIINAVEPLPAEAAVFSSVFGADRAVTLFRCAAGSRTGTLSINISRRADSSSILAILPAQEKAFPGTGAVDSLRVDVERLDDLIDADELPIPVLIKLDVQGYELEALKGMTRLIARAQNIYLEVSFETLYGDQPLACHVISWLEERGFDLAVVNDVTRSTDGVPVQADVLFTRRATGAG